MAKLFTIFLALAFSLSTTSCSPSSSLSPDGNVAEVSSTPVVTGSVALEAGLILRSGDVKPVARTEYSLLNQDLVTILEQSDYLDVLPAKAKKAMTGLKTTSEKDVGVLAMLVKFSGDDDRKDVEVLLRFRLSIAKAVAATKPFVVQSATTDFQGKTTFTNVPAGTYYLFGYSNVGSSGAVWNVKTDIKLGENSIILDNQNATVH